MKCSKPRFAFRPLVENLESRLQPGSILTGQGYGWSLLADNLPILNQGSSDSSSLVSQSSSESSRLTPTSPSADVPHDNLNIAVASVAAVRSTSLPINNVVDNRLSAGLTNQDPFGATQSEHPNSLLMAAAATPPVRMPPPATPVGSVQQSPVGVAASAIPAAPVQMAAGAPSAPAASMKSAPADTSLNAPVTLHSRNDLQPITNLHSTTLTIHAGAINTNSQPIWASYADGSILYGAPAGDSRLLGVTLDPSVNSATPNPQPVVAYGFTSSPNDPTDVAGFVARISLDGTAATVLALDAGGTGTRVEIHGAVVDPNDGSIYVAGQETKNGATTDLIEHISADLSTPLWAFGHNGGFAPTETDHANGIALDSTGTNLYATGDTNDPTTGLADVTLTQLTNLSSSTPIVATDPVSGQPQDIFFAFLDPSNNTVPNTGTGVAVDSAGNVDVALTIQGSANAFPALVQVNPSFSSPSPNWAKAFGYNTTSTNGPNATMTAVYVDSSDNVFATGGINTGLNDAGFPTLDDVLIAGYSSAGVRIGAFAESYGYSPSQGTNLPLQTIGYGIQTDPSGNIYVGVTASFADSTGALLGGVMAFLQVDPTFSNIVNDFTTDPANGSVSGSNDDQLRGIVLDPSANALYMAGFTNSPDFGQNPPDPANYISGAFQQTFGAGPYDGAVVAYSIP
jgi:hypothetical protein